MSIQLIIYLADIVDKISGMLVSIAKLGGISFIFLLSARYLGLGTKTFTRWSKIVLSIIITSTFLYAIIPSQQGIYMMAGASQVQQLTNTPEAAKVKQALDLGLDKVIKNLKEE